LVIFKKFILQNQATYFYCVHLRRRTVFRFFWIKNPREKTRTSSLAKKSGDESRVLQTLTRSREKVTSFKIGLCEHASSRRMQGAKRNHIAGEPEGREGLCSAHPSDEDMIYQRGLHLNEGQQGTGNLVPDCHKQPLL